MALVPLNIIVTQEQLGGNVPPWFVKFLSPYNDSGQKIKYALSGQIDYTTNIACQIIKLTFQTGPNYVSKQQFPVLQFQNKLSSNPFALTIGQTVRQNGGTGFDSPANPIWTQNGSTMTINWIGGLQDSSTYTITLLSR